MQAVSPTANTAPLLTYGLHLQPDPLQAGGRAVLNLVVSNATDDAITCTSIQLTLPVGTDATDLIGGATIATRPASGWSASAQGGVVTFTPPGGSAVIEGGGLVFVIATTANAQPGTATVALQETASDDGGPQQQGSGTFSVNKFPAGFSLSDLVAVPAKNLNIPYGQPAVLNWTVLGQYVSCTLQYTPGDDGVQVSQPVPNIPPKGQFETEPLTSSEGVIFTLIASADVPDLDDPLTDQRQLAVSVRKLSLATTAEPPVIGLNGLVKLSWQAANADSCFLDNTEVGVTGTLYMLLAASRLFTITAFGAGGQSDQRQVQVTVDPTIVPTEQGYYFQGGPGFNASNEGEPGGQGDNVVTAIATAPLGPASRVIPITATGGTGGQGGIQEGTGILFSGGNGGDVQITLGWDPAQTQPAQYIVILRGGAGFPPGGQNGSASLIVDGQTVTLP